MADTADQKTLDEFKKTGQIPSGYTFNGATLVRTIESKANRLKRYEEDGDSSSPQAVTPAGDVVESDDAKKGKK